ncbi:alpha-2-macroglobulin-like protein 1 [Manis javanica]|uniref:alpha-2-macroglobulin-like protein 1 n=1 Tax=Manis javanica TaxID=9974 RepID=UPI003C6CD187
MWAQLLLGILALSPAIAEKLPNYLVTLPAQLNFPSTQKVCLDLSSGFRDIKFAITLETKDKTQKLLDHYGWKKRHLYCISFLVPPPTGGTEEVATIRVSGTGNNISFEEKKKVLIRRQSNGIFIQTDKPIYNPGQQAHFRIVTLNSHFVPVNDKCSIVELQDPNGSRIAQWLDLVPEQGIIDLSFQLAPEATLGTYTVSVAEGKTFGTFSVEEYVLPKSKVEVVEPKHLSTAEESFLVKVCCRYTYGKPVLGQVQVSACQKAPNYWFPQQEKLPDKCKNLSGQTDKAGCFSESVDMSTFNLTGYRYSQSIDIVATVVEEGTGVEASTTQEIYISSQIGSMIFEDTNNFYYPNFPFTGKIRVSGYDGSLLKNHRVFLVIYGANGTISNQSLTTDNNGLAPFTLDTVSWNGAGVSLEGRFQMKDVVYDPEQVPHYYQNAYLYLQPFYNTTHSFVDIHWPSGVLECRQPQEVRVGYYINPADVDSDQEVTFTYYLIGKGSLEMAGQQHLNSKEIGLKGSFSLSLTFSSRLAPNPFLVVYAIFPSGGVIADKVQFSVEMCFDNQVSLGFSSSQQLPGAEVELHLQAAPGSLCAVRAVDESVSLLRPERELSNRSVYGMFQYWYGHYPYQVAEYDECPVSDPRDIHQPLIYPVPEKRWSRHSTIWGPLFSESMDLFRLFQEVGLKILSNAKIKKPVDCNHWSPQHTSVAQGAAFGKSGLGPVAFESSTSSPPPEDSRVRQYFPETWLWNLFPIGNLGKESVHVTVPDTITEWKAMTFCTSQSSGFGLSPIVGLTAFQPFFVDLTLPYSVIRGESFRLTATVFNYLKKCIRVQTKLAESNEYQVESETHSQASSCLCADEAKTYHWNITATKLGHVNFTISTEILDSNELCGGRKEFVPAKGRRDVLIKPVLVKPEGVLVENTLSSLLCPQGKVASESASLELPEDVVPDSAKAYVTALGDIMGTALQNLDSLVQMPRGCGEQNMVLFAPIIYVLQYLEKAGLLTEEIRSQAVGFLNMGYQKELMYKHSNGSYSAFGEQDGNGNTWLTAFVTKCFGQAQEFIFIDDKNIHDALEWMAGNQLPSGYYVNVGKLIHTAMKGGVEDETSLTAYITAALLEMGKTIEDPMVRQGLQYLKNSVSSTTNLYTQALLAYTFSLAGEMDIRNMLLEKLDQQAIVSGQSIHWSQKPTQSLDDSPWSKPESVDVELTSYVLLAQLSKASLTQKELAKATATVAWLARQRNAYGGFSSTQDTVVALQALAKYAATAYVPSEEVKVAIKSTENFQHTFNIQAANRLVSQQEILPDIPGVYTLEASGQGCVYVQMVLRYNILPPKNMETFSLSVVVSTVSCEQPRSLILTIDTSYVGSRSSSNLAIVEVKMLSGFSPTEGTIQSLLQQPLVKKVESGTDTLNIYLEEISKKTQTFTFSISQTVLVTNLKPAAVTVYDYYLPDEQATVQYSDICE